LLFRSWLQKVINLLVFGSILSYLWIQPPAVLPVILSNIQDTKHLKPDRLTHIYHEKPIIYCLFVIQKIILSWSVSQYCQWWTNTNLLHPKVNSTIFRSIDLFNFYEGLVFTLIIRERRRWIDFIILFILKVFYGGFLFIFFFEII